MCVRVRASVCERFVLVGEEQHQEQTEAFSSHERGRRRTKVSVWKPHCYNTHAEKIHAMTRVDLRE